MKSFGRKKRVTRFIVSSDHKIRIGVLVLWAQGRHRRNNRRGGRPEKWSLLDNLLRRNGHLASFICSRQHQHLPDGGSWRGQVSAPILH